jgi:hypothetical protein
MEVKLLAIEALESGAERRDVARIIGVHQSTLASWHKLYMEGGVSGMCRKSSSIAVRRQCTKLEEKIVAHRREHPEHGVRRIPETLRRSPTVIHLLPVGSNARSRTRCGRSTSSRSSSSGSTGYI